MATSGITIQQLSGDDIINAAYRKMLVIGEGQTANAQQIINGRQALNNAVAEFRTLGMSIWARKELLLPMVAGQNTYTIGVGQTVNVAFPLRIYVANLQPGPSYDTQIDMNQLSFQDFSYLPEASTGTVVNFMYQPKVNLGILTVWPTPQTGTTDRVQLLYQSPFDYFITGTDTPDFPEEWNNALIYMVALLLSDENGLSTQKQQWLEKQADKHLATALSGGTEEASMFIQRDWVGDM